MTCLDCKNSYLEISRKQPQEQDCLLHHITQFKNTENTNRPSLSNKAMYTYTQVLQDLVCLEGQEFPLHRLYLYMVGERE